MRRNQHAWLSALAYFVAFVLFAVAVEFFASGRLRLGLLLDRLAGLSLGVLVAIAVGVGFLGVLLGRAVVSHLLLQYPRGLALRFSVFCTALILSAIGIYGWGVFVGLRALRRWYSGSTVGLDAWVIEAPQQLQQIGGAGGELAKLAIIALGAWLVALYARSVFREWSRISRLIGAHAMRRGAWLMARLAYRAPWRSMQLNAPGISLLYLTIAAGLIHLQAAWSPFGLAGIVIVIVLVGILVPLTHICPPVLLWLSASEYEQFAALKNVQKVIPGGVKTLVNQVSPSVLEQYHQHYLRRFADRATYASGSSRWKGGVALRVLPMFLRPDSPRSESLRTRTGLWERTALDLIEFARIVVIDARVITGPVVQEIGWMLDAKRIHKAIFLVDDLREAAELQATFRRLGHGKAINALLVNEKLLYDVVRKMAQSSATLPKPDDRHWIEDLDMTVTTLESLTAALTNPTTSNHEMDALIWSWDTGRPRGEIEPGNFPPVSSSVDAAMALGRKRFPYSSWTLSIAVNGTAWAEVGIIDGNENFRVSASSPADNLTPARALLQTLLRAELGWTKRPEPDEDSHC